MTKRSYRYTSGLTLIIALSMTVAQTGTESVVANDMKSVAMNNPERSVANQMACPEFQYAEDLSSHNHLVESLDHVKVSRRGFIDAIAQLAVTRSVAAFIPGELSTRALSADLRVLPTQDNWRYCKFCNALFFNGYPNKGKCPAGRTHMTNLNTNFVLTYDPLQQTPGRSEQPDWRFCVNCEALFYDGFSKKGVCQAGGGHASAGHNFRLTYDGGKGKDWRYCNNCQVLFLNDGLTRGVCSAGEVHVAAGHNFVLRSKPRH